MRTTLQSLRIYIVLSLLTGIIYPLAMTGVAQLLFPKQANGSRVFENAKLLGSDLLAQKFDSPRYFWPRPSAVDYATVASGASNKGPTSADLKRSIDERRAKFGADAPVDLLTASGSGLDPHISPEAARLQIPRVAAARNISSEKISDVVDQTIERPQLGFLGEPRLNVLKLNLALDQLR
ncbi:MAG: potassium-transporting ATPase KdpC subunit [Verrucomicrobiota bacterium]|jgi:K+-transporting ATPase ATPase C chain